MSRSKNNPNVHNNKIDHTTKLMENRPNSHTRFERVSLLLQMLRIAKVIGNEEYAEGRARIENIHNSQCEFRS